MKGAESGNRTHNHRVTNTVLCQLSYLSVCCAAALLASCASVPEGPKELLVPVASSCVPQGTPPAPQTVANQSLRALDDHRLVLTIAAERLDLIAWVRQIEPVLQACRE